MATPSFQNIFYFLFTSLIFSSSFLGNKAHAFPDRDALAIPESSPLMYASPKTIAEPPSVGGSRDDALPEGDGWDGAPTPLEGGSNDDVLDEGEGSWGAPTPSSTNSFVSVPVVKDTPAVNMFVQSAMVASMSKTEDFIHDVIEKRLKDPNTDGVRKECLKMCKDVYEDSMKAMKKTVEDTKDGNLYKANVDMSAMSTDIDTCKDCMGHVYNKNDPEFKKFSAWIDGMANDCLDKITGLGD
ncbi:hypothetical protein DM860_003410 [Cuscuta australis]|uniref:Pectinesterase inhibitor domain-containing protein n=2 Tax=Cuscuta sect. Cleistogrammica TaxID=1824901 RepID=A0A328DKF5_9ASTE|nr:hypothetical protein DM860_003410 [Cuscuta australis]